MKFQMDPNGAGLESFHHRPIYGEYNEYIHYIMNIYIIYNEYIYIYIMIIISTVLFQ